MLDPTTAKKLALPEFIGAFDRLAKEAENLIGDTARFLTDHDEPPRRPKQAELQDLQRKLLDEVARLDQKLQDVLARNTWALLARALVLVFMLAVFAVGMAVVVLRQAWFAGVVPSIASLAVLGWALRSLKQLQDERLHLLFRVHRFRPRVLTCTSVDCLRQIAGEIARDLEFLQPRGET